MDAVVDAVSEYIGLNVSDKYYTVVRGDSLWSISKKYGITVDELKNANNLTSNSLSIGQILIIPSKKETPITQNTYTVVSGDSLYSIARRFNTTVDAIKSLNNLTTNNLAIGQILMLPQSINIEPQDYINYTVVKGDNLYAIARRYNTTQDELMKFNNLSSNLLSIGQIIKIPTNTKAEITYTVKSGDNLYNIANRYNTTVNEIKSKNNLTSNVLQIGQTLKIPT